MARKATWWQQFKKDWFGIPIDPCDKKMSYTCYPNLCGHCALNEANKLQKEKKAEELDEVISKWNKSLFVDPGVEIPCPWKKEGVKEEVVEANLMSGMMVVEAIELLKGSQRMVY